MADGKIQTPFSEITSPGGLKCQEFGGRRGFEERQVAASRVSLSAFTAIMLSTVRPCAMTYSLEDGLRIFGGTLSDMLEPLRHIARE